MFVVETVDAARGAVCEAQHRGLKVGLVPTMGAFHAGHMSLMEEARRRCGHVAVTIFVNPTQFVPGEDFDAYPRTLETDLEACKRAGVDTVFTPSTDEMYRAGATTKVSVAGLTDGLCGARRPGHFDGVTTIVAKLFNILPADVAFFGEKDYQQLVVIRRMVADLDIPIEIVACPTVREADGLAMSSRNAYLSPAQRAQAVALSAALFEARDGIRAGERDPRPLVQGIRDRIESALSEPGCPQPGQPVGRAFRDEPSECRAKPDRRSQKTARFKSTIEYVEIVNPETLEPLRSITGPYRICLAVRIGDCRLIDNIAADPNPRV